MRYLICMRAINTWSEPDPKGTADILLIDTDVNNGVRKIATTHTWNVQQGCMAQWLGPDFKSRILYNDMRNGKYCSVILDIVTGEERILPLPCYTVSSDGKTALSLDFLVCITCDWDMDMLLFLKKLKALHFQILLLFGG